MRSYQAMIGSFVLALLLAHCTRADDLAVPFWKWPAPVAGPDMARSTTDWRVLCFLGVECPVARFYASRLESMSQRLAATPATDVATSSRAPTVEFVGIYSNLHDSVDDIVRFTKEMKLTFPQVKDVDQRMAVDCGVKRVPEVVVLDKDRRVRYRGRIDDQYAPGVLRSAPAKHDLEVALQHLMRGEEPPQPSTEPVGCLITYAKTVNVVSDVTYCRSVAPILFQHCLECHREGEIGPFDMADYDEVRGWADMIVEVIDNGRMPPWHADAQYGSFKNHRALPAEAIRVIHQWVDAGTPYGDKADLPTPPAFAAGWRLRQEPDLVVKMRSEPYHIPADGTVDYQYFVVDPQLHEDRWISAAQVVPGNRSVVHHAIVFLRPPDGVALPGIGWLTAYVPGQHATTFPAGYARKIPAGSKLVFQMHYAPNGQEQFDCTQVGLTFIDPQDVSHQVYTVIGIDQHFEIPPETANHQVVAPIREYPAHGELLAIIPHMHLRGKAFQLERSVRQPDGNGTQREILLNVPHYDFNWQHTYELASPLRLDQTESLQFTASFDNSRANPFNPDPEQYVAWGDQTWEEMAVVFLEMAVPRQTTDVTDADSEEIAVAAASLPAPSTDPASGNHNVPANQRSIDFAKRFLARWDGNRDGVVGRPEVSRIIRDYSFRLLDGDRNGRVTESELIEASEKARER